MVRSHRDTISNTKNYTDLKRITYGVLTSRRHGYMVKLRLQGYR